MTYYYCRRSRPLTAPGKTWYRLFDVAAAVALAVMDRRARRR